MSANPYQSPLLHDLALPDHLATVRGRPIGISLLSVLHVVGGVLAVLVMGFVLWEALTERRSELEPPLWLMMTFLVVYIVLLLGSGLGMWLGAKWGWWLGNFVYFWNLVVGLVQIPILLWNSGGSIFTDNPSWLVQNSTSLAITSLVVLYFFKRSVREFFGLRSMKILFALLLLSLVSLLFVAGQMALAAFNGLDAV